MCKRILACARMLHRTRLLWFQFSAPLNGIAILPPPTRQFCGWGLCCCDQHHAFQGKSVMPTRWKGQFLLQQRPNEKGGGRSLQRLCPESSKSAQTGMHSTKGLWLTWLESLSHLLSHLHTRPSDDRLRCQPPSSRQLKAASHARHSRRNSSMECQNAADLLLSDGTTNTS